MKKLLLFLMMLSSSMIFSQTTVKDEVTMTVRKAQIIKKDLNELKNLRIEKKSADILISEQKKALDVAAEKQRVSDLQNENIRYQWEQDKVATEAKFNEIIASERKEHKKEKRRKFWTGMGIGTGTGAALTIIGLIFINK